MPGLLPFPDPDGLLEYSVVFTDRSLNHMSKAFQQVMLGINGTLKEVYNAHAVAIVPGGGSYGMEAIARQFANGKHVLILRNGFFSFRWTQILEAGNIAQSSTVCKAQRIAYGATAPFVPAPLEDVLASIRRVRPAVVFAPHVETASGIILPDDYIRAVGEAVRGVGGIFVLDCVASGAVWVDMQANNVDVLLSAPQKGWSASPCAALVMLGERALLRMADTASSSFACNLKRWRQIMEAYENGGHAYHATMPTDALVQLWKAMQEAHSMGWETLREAQWTLGKLVRTALAQRGFASVAAAGFEAPGVVVSYTDDPEIRSGAKFVACGVQIAAGVPLQCDEGDDFSTFRLGLFGLDKLHNPHAACDRLMAVVDQLR